MKSGLTRRIALAGATTWMMSGSGRAQPTKRRLLGALSGGSREAGAAHWRAFEDALRAVGYGEKEVAIESRWADGQNQRLPELATELVGLAPDVIVAGSSAAALALKQTTSIIPIVMAFTADPVGAGLVASIARPGANVTGLSNIKEDTAGKEVELLKAAAPNVARVAVLTNPANPSHAGEWRGAQETARSLGIELLAAEVRRRDEIDQVFATMASVQTDGVVVLADPLFFTEASRIAELATSYKLPAIYGFREHVIAGGLMSYGPDIKDSFRRAASYVDKILRGASPADLPVEQPTKFDLAINLKAAKALGLTIPPTLLARADEVIE